MVFGIDFGCLMARFLGPTWLPKSIKIGPKSASRCTSFGTSFLGTFWVRFWDQLGANRTQKSLIFHYVFHIFLKIDLCKLASISNFIWVPTWLHFPLQHRFKSARRWVPRAMQILMEFWIIFLSFLAPFGPIFGAKLGGKMDQKSIQDSIDKAMKKETTHRWTTKRQMSRLQPGKPPPKTPGEGVGGGVSPSPEGLRKEFWS